MDNIRFSIIIPVAPDRIPEVIKGLEFQNYPSQKYEIIIKKGTNTSQNRNDGVKEAKGEYIAFVDDDAIVEKDWLIKADKVLEQYPDADVVGGPQLTPPDDTAFGHASGIAFSSIICGASIRNRYRKGKLNLNSDERELSSANIFCKKTVFEEIIFNTDFWPGEDPIFFNELIRKEKKLVYSPDLYVYHKRRSSPKSLFTQVFRYGYVRPKIKSIKKTGLFSFLFIIPSLFVIYLLTLPLLLLWNNFLLFLPVSIYLLLLLLFTGITAIKEKKSVYLLLIPAVFLIIHTAYGTGFLCGEVKKWIK